jgi:hypothetical protein
VLPLLLLLLLPVAAACCLCPEYAWHELAGYLSETGYHPFIRNFNAYVADDLVFNHTTNTCLPQYNSLWQAIPAKYRSLNVLGSTIFMMAKKVLDLPAHRRSWRLYAFNKDLVFKGYAACTRQPALCTSGTSAIPLAPAAPVTAAAAAAAAAAGGAGSVDVLQSQAAVEDIFVQHQDAAAGSTQQLLSDEQSGSHDRQQRSD